MDEQRRARIEQIKLMAEGICAGVRDKETVQPHNCWCNGDKGRCTAVSLYGDFAMHALLALERAGFTVVPSGNAKLYLTEPARRVIIPGSANGADSKGADNG